MPNRPQDLYFFSFIRISKLDLGFDEGTLLMGLCTAFNDLSETYENKLMILTEDHLGSEQGIVIRKCELCTS